MSSNKWLPLIVAVSAVLGILIGFRVNEKIGVRQSTAYSDGVVDEIVSIIDAKYIEDVDREALVERAVDAITTDLDPHSQYIPPSEIQAVQNSLKGNFNGMGIEYLIVEDTLTVMNVIPGSPALEAGIQSGDEFLSVGSTSIPDTVLSMSEVLLKEQDEAKKVSVSFLRNGNSMTTEITLAPVEVNSVSLAYMVDSVTGYIKLSTFSSSTYQEFMLALEELEKEGLKNLVLDLRDNHGGYLDQAVSILNQFFNEEVLLVYTMGRDGNKIEQSANKKSFFKVDEVVVLINEESASASEIMAGAIQDLDRGTIIGRRSFGKGLVQTQEPLSNGGALRLTISRYYLPSGRSIQKTFSGTTDYESVEDRYYSSELFDSTAIKLTDSIKFYTREGRTVYGGSGIIPDQYIPLERSVTDTSYWEAYSLLRVFAADYYDENRSEFTSFNNVDDYDAQFVTSDKVSSSFVDFVLQETATQYTFSPETTVQLKKDIKLALLEVIFGKKALLKFNADNSEELKKAMEVIYTK